MIRCVGAIIHDSAGRLLLVRRANNPGRGRWSLPGGKVDDGETDTAAVIRELREETGLVVRPGRLVGSARRATADLVFVIFDYAAEIIGGTLVAGDDATDAAFLDHAAMAELERTGALVDRLADTLRDWNVMPRS